LLHGWYASPPKLVGSTAPTSRKRRTLPLTVSVRRQLLFKCNIQTAWAPTFLWWRFYYRIWLFWRNLWRNQALGPRVTESFP
jgi:hypothetical protein